MVAYSFIVCYSHPNFHISKGRPTGLKEFGCKCSWTENKIIRLILSIKMPMQGLVVRERKLLSMGVKERKTAPALMVSIWCPLLHLFIFLNFCRIRRKASVCCPFLHSSALLLGARGVILADVSHCGDGESKIFFFFKVRGMDFF